MVIRFLCAIFFAWGTCAVAADTISLREYLDRANQGAITVIYSNDLVLTSYRVTFDPHKTITAEKLRTILRHFKLQFQMIGSGKYIVVSQGLVQEPGNLVPLEGWKETSIKELIVTSSVAIGCLYRMRPAVCN